MGRSARRRNRHKGWGGSIDICDAIATVNDVHGPVNRHWEHSQSATAIEVACTVRC